MNPTPATFCVHVLGVLPSGTDPQMVGVDARWRVATVQHVEAGRNRADVQFVRYSVRPAHRAPLFKLSVAPAGERSLPQPAAGSHSQLFVETFFARAGLWAFGLAHKANVGRIVGVR